MNAFTDADPQGDIHLEFARSTQKIFLILEGPPPVKGGKSFPQRGPWEGYAVAFHCERPIEAGTLPPARFVMKFDPARDCAGKP